MFMAMIGILGVLILIVGICLVMIGPRLGGSAKGERLQRMQRSAHYRDGKFQNPVPTDNSWGPGKMWRTLKDYSKSQKKVPVGPLPVAALSRESFTAKPASGLRITWLGHSSALIEIDGYVVLLDPVFSERASPLSFIGPKRFHPAPISVSDLPSIDAVVISHDHFDHLDYDSVVKLTPKTTTFYLPLGIGAHLEKWEVPPDKIVELDWWEEKAVGNGLRLIACPARHFSGRKGFGDLTLWASWALVGPSHRVFFSGDTGIMPLFKEVGERFGPFDAALIKIGAYGNTWHDIHVDPEEGVAVHRMVKGQLMIPIHWGTFNLSYHSWTEPAERLIVAAEQDGTQIAIPRPGQSIDPMSPSEIERWWQEK